MLKQVVVFGSKIGENIIGNIIEENLPVDVIKLANQENQPYRARTESELREWVEEELTPYMGKADVIVLCEPEMTLSSIQFLQRKYPEQKIIGYGQNLSGVIRGERAVRVLLPHAAKRMVRYQEIKSECGNVEISEGEYDPAEDTVKPPISSTIERILKDFPGGLVVLYTPDLICIKEQIKKRIKWRATVVDMCDSLFRETCKALELRGIDGRLIRELEG